MRQASRPNPYERRRGARGRGDGPPASENATPSMPPSQQHMPPSPTPTPPASVPLSLPSPSPDRSLGYKLIQLRPHPSMLSPPPGTPAQATPCETPSRTKRLSRWLFVYLPLLAFLVGVLYVLTELALKQLVMWNFRRQVCSLPDDPPSLHTPPPPPEKSAPPPPPPPPVDMNVRVGPPEYDYDTSLLSSLPTRREAL